MNKFVAVYLLFFLVVPLDAAGQGGVRRGVVWDVPTGLSRAELDLQQMADAGVQAVRTDVIRRGRLLTLADTLGLGLHVDLPVSYLPAARLGDTLSFAAAVLDTVLGLAQVHASIRDVGVARYVDSSDSTTCRHLAELVAAGRRVAPAGMRFYYTTSFVENDVCSHAVDYVLLDVRDRVNPSIPLRKWIAGSPGRSPAGIGALGVRVRGDTLDGLRVPGSLARHARYFESHLPILLSDTLSARPPAVFVYRWRDQRRDYPSPVYDLDNPYLLRYGLLAMDGSRRPAMDVVSGIYTEGQTVFAFERGDAVPANAPWTTILGWAVILLLGTFYALSPRFRHMIPRYFQAHFFFREAVREGRDVLFGSSIILLTALGIACGLATFVVLDAVRATEAFAMTLRWFPESLQVAFITLLAEPWVLVLLAGCLYVLILLLWTVVLALFSRKRYPVAPAQVLMLVVWPRWPLILAMLAAMVIASVSFQSLLPLAGLLAAWLVIEIAALGRTLYDLVAVTRMPPYMLLPCVLLHPGVMAAIALAISLLPYGPELTYLWHVATRS